MKNSHTFLAIWKTKTRGKMLSRNVKNGEWDETKRKRRQIAREKQIWRVCDFIRMLHLFWLMFSHFSHLIYIRKSIYTSWCVCFEMTRWRGKLAFYLRVLLKTASTLLYEWKISLEIHAAHKITGATNICERYFFKWFDLTHLSSP